MLESLVLYKFTDLLLNTGVEIHSSMKFGEGTGPIFLERLNCLGQEPSILLCPKQQPLGLHTCTHQQDVGVVCNGETMQGPAELRYANM